MRVIRFYNSIKWVYFLIPLFFSIHLFSQNDTINLDNGDRLVGEIQRMDKGIIHVDSDYGDEIFKLKWNTVQSLKTNQTFLVLLSNGERIKFDSLLYDKKDNSFHLRNKHNSIIGDSLEIVFLQPIEEKIISRFEASVAAGFNYTKNSSLRQLNLNTSTNYVTTYWSWDTTLGAIWNNQNKELSSQRIEFDSKFRYYLSKHYFLFYWLKLLFSTELNLDIRTTNKAGLGRYFVRNNVMYFLGGVGLSWNNEIYDLEQKYSRNSVEVLGVVEINYFDLENLTLSTRVSAYPNLTQKDRFRLDVEFDAKYDLPLDFFIKLGYKYNFDSGTIESALKDDYIFQMGFGWDF